MKKERIFWGIFFIAAAVFLVVGKFGLLEGFSFWSLILTVFFGACLIKSIISRSISGVLFSVAFLCIVYAQPLGIEAITPWPVLGAALLGSIGCGFLYHPKRNYTFCGSNHRGGSDSYTTETINDAQMEFSASFGESIKYVNSDDFQNAKLKCSFGSMKVYFDNAMIQNGRAVVDMDVSFAGVELYIPKTWTILNHTEGAFAGINEKNRNESNGTPTLELIGKISFGGVEVIYV